ncbi:MAG: hypothetical protein IT162_05325 [Bryobacterales bacterium]|nr:hypothetical protein [Bryobacterales bacterium]
MNLRTLPLWLLLAGARLTAQIIEFESGGLHYQTQTKGGVTVMFAALPTVIREFSVIQVAISNGSKQPWIFRPQDFKVVRESGKAPTPGAEARTVVNDFMRNGGREDVIKLVTAYENGLYGMTRPPSTNGYEQRRQSVMAEMTSSRLKAAAAASAIVLVASRLKPGESTDGAVFFSTQGKPLGAGKLVIEAGPSVYEFPLAEK